MKMLGAGLEPAPVIHGRDFKSPVSTISPSKQRKIVYFTQNERKRQVLIENKIVFDEEFQLTPLKKSLLQDLLESRKHLDRQAQTLPKFERKRSLSPSTYIC